MVAAKHKHKSKIRAHVEAKETDMTKMPPSQFSLFGIRIHNDSMAEAVEKVMAFKRVDRAQTVCFVNVNTINLAKMQPALNHAVNDANWVFADGSGVRIAAKRQGVVLKDNVNGTDMLPHICARAAKQGSRLFLLGAAPGVAETAARKLANQFPGLKVVGTQHGYFDQSNSEHVIKQINDVNTDLLLVAFGSPIQESWLQKHRDRLEVDTALAVGGLFDFFSGRIPRAPLWLRQRGCEWIWRLFQEPRKKFNRYVIGNPAFLWRCFWQLKKVY